MTSSKQVFLALVISTGWLGAEPFATDPAPQLTIRVYDYADINPKLLEKASEQTTEIFSRTGVNLRWEQCRTSDREANRDSSCAQRVGPSLIQLRIHPRDMAKKATKRAVEFGYSIPLAEGKFGTVAGVYFERTHEMAKPLGLDLHVVLGHTIAHEIGHLLLGTNSHASSGIMRPTWRDHELRLASSGVLGFTEEQSRRMKVQVEARLR